MVEKVITVYAKKELIGLVLVNEIDMGYVDKKLVSYTEERYKGVFERVLKSLGQGHINTSTIQGKLCYGLKKDLRIDDILVMNAIPLISNNKNKTSRNRRMLNNIMGSDKKIARVVYHIGTQNS